MAWWNENACKAKQGPLSGVTSLIRFPHRPGLLATRYVDIGGVENPLQWRLEVIPGDDASRIRKGNGPAMMTSIRYLCMNLFECESSSMSLAKKRRKAAWNDNYRAKVMFSR